MKPFKPDDPRSLSLRTHCQTSGWSLAAQDVFNNVARTMIEAMAATQGQTQSLHTNALDEALALPTDFSARIARNTQIVLQQEAGATRIVDPWGGSYYVERLTYELAHKAWGHIEEVEGLGGMAKAIEAGIPKLRIEEAAAKTQARIDAGMQFVIGVNKYPPTDEAPIDVLKIDNSAVRARQIEQLKRLKAERDPAALQEALDALTRAADRGNGNLLALAVDAARAKATVGEISSALEQVFGRHRAEIKAITGVYKREVGMKLSNRPKAAARGCLSPRLGKTGTTGGRKSLLRHSPTWALTSISVRFSQPRPKQPVRRSRMTFMFLACLRSRPLI
jgi:methylmalonyl-CoA mutase